MMAQEVRGATFIVIPAKAGIHGATGLDARLRGHDEHNLWAPS